MALSGAAAAVVELADGDHLVYRTARGTASRFIGERIPRAGSLSGRCLEEARVLYAPDTARDDRVNDHKRRNRAARHALGSTTIPIGDLRR